MEQKPKTEQEYAYVKPILRSQTMRWIIVAGITYLVRIGVVPMLPETISAEVTNGVILALDVLVPIALARAAQGRIRARTKIRGWLK